MDPNEPLLGELHEKLCNLDISHFMAYFTKYGKGGNGGDPGPDFKFVHIDDNSDEKALARKLGSNMYTGLQKKNTIIEQFFDSGEDFDKAVEKHNNSIDRLDTSDKKKFQGIISKYINCLDMYMRTIGNLKITTLFENYEDKISFNNTLSFMQHNIALMMVKYNLIVGAKLHWETKNPVFEPFGTG